MKPICLFLLALVLIGCGENPHAGDWYENIESRERIKIIAVGIPDTLFSRHLEASSDSQIRVRDSLNIITSLVFDSINHSSTICFMARTNRGKTLIIKPIVELEENYSKVKK